MNWLIHWFILAGMAALVVVAVCRLILGLSTFISAIVLVVAVLVLVFGVIPRVEGFRV